MNKLFLIALLFLVKIVCFSQSDSITNIQVSQRTDGSGYVDVYYSLAGSESSYIINMEVSLDGGGSYKLIPTQYLSGDVATIPTGVNKHIAWNGFSTFPNTFSEQVKIKIIANTFISEITDYDGNVYPVVTLGTQTWMAENLKVTHYRNGTAIECPGTNQQEWIDNTVGAYAWYNNDIGWKDLYGALYNWYAVDNENGLCPTGWHIPTDADWTQLTNSITGGIDEGGMQLKSCRQVNSPLPGECNTIIHPRWDYYDSNICGTDEYGFGAQAGGYRYSNGNFAHMGYGGYWWSSTTNNSALAWGRFMGYFYSNVYRTFHYMAIGFCVRCIKD